MKKYEYFVSYAHTRGSGNCLWTLDFIVDSIDSYNMLNNLVKENNPEVEDIVILNFIKLK